MPEAGTRGGAGEVDAFFNTIRLSTHVSDNKSAFEEERRSRRGTVETRGMGEGINKFIHTDTMKALMSLGEARRWAYNWQSGTSTFTVLRTVQKHQTVVHGSVLLLKRYDAGASQDMGAHTQVPSWMARSGHQRGRVDGADANP